MMPAVKLVQSATLVQHIQTRTKIEMIGIAKYYLGFYLIFQVADMRGLHTADSTHRHKNRGLYVSMVGGKEAGTGIALRIVFNYAVLHL
jgi:hypothetical protein